MTEELSKISDFLESIEAVTTDKSIAKKIRDFMTKEGLWEIPTAPQKVHHEPRDPEVYEHIVYNAVKCHECGQIIESHHTHDYKTCGCDNEAMVDGGIAYARYGAKDMTKITKITYTDQDPHDLIREFASWGTYGKTGNEPLKYVKIKDMTDDHVRAVIVYPRGASWFKELLKNELEYRAEFNISITE